MKGRLWAVCTAVIWALALPQSALSITIDWSNRNTSGFDANERAVVDEAIAEWARLIPNLGNTADPTRNTFRVTITEDGAIRDYATTGMFMEDANGIPQSADIMVDRGDPTDATAFQFFVDTTPADDSEFNKGTNSFHGVPRPGGGTGGNATGRVDLLEVIKHELGHALGFTRRYTLFAAAENPPGTLNYAPGMTATLVPAPTHLDPTRHPDDLMGNEPNAKIEGGHRWLPSELDLDILAGIYGYTVREDQLRKIPEPATILLFGTGLAALVVSRKRVKSGEQTN